MHITGGKFRLLALGAATAMLVAGCAAADPAPSKDGVEASAGASPGAPSSAELFVSDPLLDSLGVDGLSGRQMVDHLDRVAGPERNSEIMASVRTNELVVTDGARDVVVPLPEDEFYLSVAPYVAATHECFYHSLTTCQGELSDTPIDVIITTTSGEVLHDGQVTTFDNGFAGFWLPRGSHGTIELDHDGRSTTIPFSTDDDAPTCVTTAQLT